MVYYGCQPARLTTKSFAPTTAAMGSLGWAQCYWCWKWRYNMYIPDWMAEPLCGDCIDRMLANLGPPWWPDSRTRVELVVTKRLPASAARLIAEFARSPFEP